MVLIASDWFHRCIDLAAYRYYRETRHELERYSRGSVGEYIRVGQETAEDKQSAVWCCILIDAPATGSGGEGGEEEEDETENRGGD